MEQEIRLCLEEAIHGAAFPGASVGVVTRSGAREFVSAGRFTYESGSQVVGEDTIYDVASITKAVPLALAALKYIEMGKLGLDDHITKYLPEVVSRGADTALIRHLLTYTYTLEKNADPNFSYANSKAQDIFDFLYMRPLAYPPGTQYHYSNTPANLLGLILERISGEKLHTLAQRIILDPLQMAHSTFHPANREAVPPTEVTSWRGEIQGDVHDETAFILERKGFDPGCAGLFSTAGDVLNAAEMILNQGSFRGQKILDIQTISSMQTNALANIGQWSGIGWELNQKKFMGTHAHEHMLGKTGFTGTSCVIDPRSGKAVVILANRTYPNRSADSKAIDAVRRAVADIVFAP